MRCLLVAAFIIGLAGQANKAFAYLQQSILVSRGLEGPIVDKEL